MIRLAACTLAVLAVGGLAPGALAQPTGLPLVSATVGAGPNGPAATLAAGPNLGRLSPQLFATVTTREERYPFLTPEDPRLGRSYRAAVGAVARIAVDPSGGRFDLSAIAGGAFALSGTPSQFVFEDGTRGRRMGRTGVVGVLGAEATAWITRSVGLSLTAHQSVTVAHITQTHSERFGAPGLDPDGTRGSYIASPSLDQWGLGLGLRIGRQR